MDEFKRIQMSLFLIPLLHFTAAAAATGQTFLFFTVRDGGEVTLPCENMIHEQEDCGYTTWLFIGLESQDAVELVTHGKTDNKTKPDRLRVTEKCSLVIKKVTGEDVGRYTCRQFNISGPQQGQDFDAYLSVVTMTEQKDGDEVTLLCSVKTNEPFKHTVRWLLKSQDVDKELMTTSESSCSSSVTFSTSHYSYTSRYKLFTCEVTDEDRVQVFPFRPQSSGENTTATTKPTTTTRRSENSIKTGRWWWWWLIVVFVGVASFLIITVAVIRWKRTKGKKTQMDEDMVDPEDGVSYASISYTKKTNSRAKVWGKDDDDEEDDAVTYSTVKPSSSSSSAAGASSDLSNLYAVVNKPNK